MPMLPRRQAKRGANPTVQQVVETPEYIAAGPVVERPRVGYGRGGRTHYVLTNVIDGETGAPVRGEKDFIANSLQASLLKRPGHMAERILCAREATAHAISAYTAERRRLDAVAAGAARAKRHREATVLDQLRDVVDLTESGGDLFRREPPAATGAAEAAAEHSTPRRRSAVAPAPHSPHAAPQSPSQKGKQRPARRQRGAVLDALADY